MKRFFDNYATTIAGIFVVFIMAGYVYLKEKPDSVAIGSMCTLATLLFRAKDSLIGLEAK